jgi:hypothetical protein
VRAALLVLAAVALMAPALARADGDPASDWLLSEPSYVPLQPAPGKPLRDELNALLRAGAQQRHPLRVAIVRTKGDLGAYPQLYGRPQVYARLLSNELAYVYKGQLLVVMPQGFATRNIPAATAERLHGLAIDASTVDAMTQDSITASRRLLTADGVNLAGVAAAEPRSSGSSTGPWLWVGVVAAGAVIGGGAAAAALHWRRA